MAADKKFMEALTKKFKEDPTDRTTTFYNLGGWRQSERKTEFVKEGEEIAKKRGIPMYNPDVGSPLGQRALMSYQLSTTDTFVEGDDLHFINNAAIQQAWDDIRRTVIVGLNTAHTVLEKRLNKLELKNSRYKDNSDMRKALVITFTTIITFWLLSVLLILVGNRVNRYDLSENTLIAFLTTSSANVLGMMYVILKNLFPNGKDKNNPKNNANK